MLNQEESQELARTRVQNDTRPLKRIIKEFYRLANPELKGDELLAAHETFILSLEQLATGLAKTSRIQQVTEMEVLTYQREALSIEQQQEETTAKIEQLKMQLELAQRDRARRIQYDQMAREIRKMPDREQGQSSNNKLNEDIRLLKEEQDTYKGTWARRTEEFAGIVDSLTAMRDTIAEEKAEQERRQALDDEEPPAPAPLDPTAPAFEPRKPEEGTQGDVEMGNVEGSTEGGGEEGNDVVMEGEGDGGDGEADGEVKEELEEGQEREPAEEGEV
ncbi:hypothetical protein T439DRAFT_329983 [Meredithblackwellia eburnea MCA 4105]